jgi:hypothetical protein
MSMDVSMDFMAYVTVLLLDAAINDDYIMDGLQLH